MSIKVAKKEEPPKHKVGFILPHRAIAHLNRIAAATGHSKSELVAQAILALDIDDQARRERLYRELQRQI